jgi:hypothetical protein
MGKAKTGKPIRTNAQQDEAIDAYLKGPERDAVESAKQRKRDATDAWVQAGSPSTGDALRELADAEDGLKAALDALHMRAFGNPFPDRGPNVWRMLLDSAHENQAGVATGNGE